MSCRTGKRALQPLSTIVDNQVLFFGAEIHGHKSFQSGLLSKWFGGMRRGFAFNHTVFNHTEDITK